MTVATALAVSWQPLRNSNPSDQQDLAQALDRFEPLAARAEEIVAECRVPRAPAASARWPHWPG
jgi:hypothetical protein